MKIRHFHPACRVWKVVEVSVVGVLLEYISIGGHKWLQFVLERGNSLFGYYCTVGRPHRDIFP
jgi:hypothetical protein